MVNAPVRLAQFCTVHLIRAAMRFVSDADRKKVAAALRPIYTAPTAEAAEAELLAFVTSELAARHSLTLWALAEELAWPAARRRELLGLHEPRPALRLVP
jgi:transposase-like protein